MVTATASLDELFQEYESWLTVERGLSHNSIEAYKKDLAGYARFLASRHIKQPSRITEELVAAYVQSLRDERTEEKKPKYAPSSIARAVAAVRSFHRFCLEEGLLTQDPSSGTSAPTVPQGIPKALSEAEVEKLLGAVIGDHPAAQRDRAILETLYATGIRIAELASLDLDALDLDVGVIRVLGKGNKERYVPIGAQAVAALEVYINQGRPNFVKTRGEHDAVFLNVRGGRLSRQACWRIVRTNGERAGLGEQLHPHILRHSCATHMVDHGADIRVVQELLGHSRISTTQVYTKVSPERLRAAYDSAHPRAR